MRFFIGAKMTKLNREQFKAVLAERCGSDICEKLDSAVVGIAGLGGLGSNVAMALARAGIGKLVIADFDTVEPSNLNRQNYSVSQLGCDKVAATTENLKQINPYVNIDRFSGKLTAENIPDVFSSCSIIAECFDKVDQKKMLIETALCEMDKTIVVAASGLAGYGKSNDIKTRKINSRLIMTGDGKSGIENNLPLFAARVIIAAGHQANAIIELIIETT